MRTITRLITPDRAKWLAGRTKSAVLEELVELLATAPEVRDAEALRRSIFEREAVMSTGIGQGLAVPHARLDSVTDFVAAVGLSKEGIPFDAFDDAPVHILVMIAGPHRHREYLQILARVMLAMKREENRQTLLGLRSGKELVQHLEKMTGGPGR